MEICKQLRGENEALSQMVSGGSGTAQGEEDKVKKLTKLTDTLRYLRAQEIQELVAIL